METKEKRVMYTTTLFQNIIDIIKKSSYESGDNANLWLERAVWEYAKNLERNPIEPQNSRDNPDTSTNTA